MDELMSLDMLPLKQSAVILSVQNDGDMSERLKELGFIKNAVVRAAHKSHEGGVTAYEVMGVVFALRKHDAKKITVGKSAEIKQTEVCRWI